VYSFNIHTDLDKDIVSSKYLKNVLQWSLAVGLTVDKSVLIHAVMSSDVGMTGGKSVLRYSIFKVSKTALLWSSDIGLTVLSNIRKK
jgi:hypothetical protein